MAEGAKRVRSSLSDSQKTVVDLTVSSDEEYDDDRTAEEKHRDALILAALDRDLYPSKIFDDYWVFSYDSVPFQPHISRSGKWLLFVHVRDLDSTWQLIKKETEESLLGPCSKVATARDSPLAQNKNTKVICVYTYDYDDYEDVVRVRDRLRVIGFTKVLRYKTDDATHAGQYSHSASGPVSKYTL